MVLNLGGLSDGEIICQFPVDS